MNPDSTSLDLQPINNYTTLCSLIGYNVYAKIRTANIEELYSMIFQLKQISELKYIPEQISLVSYYNLINVSEYTKLVLIPKVLQEIRKVHPNFCLYVWEI